MNYLSFKLCSFKSKKLKDLIIIHKFSSYRKISNSKNFEYTGKFKSNLNLSATLLFIGTLGLKISCFSYSDISNNYELSNFKTFSTDSTASFERLDEIYLSKNPKWVKYNAIHDTLRGKEMIESYQVYRKIDSNEVWAVVKIGKSLNGFPHLVHGGVTSALFDNTFGWLFISLGYPPAVTANLSVNFR
jgi:hypothetical protein